MACPECGGHAFEYGSGAVDIEYHCLQSSAHIPLSNEDLLRWVSEMRDMCKPAHVQWATGTDEEYAELCKLMVKGGKFIRLNEKKRPNSFLCRSDPADIAHVEKQTFICTTDSTDAGPTNN
jgi:phosphoenolpyruvate carboxykinase (GTP)